MIIAMLLWVTLSYQLSFNQHLGAASLGAFLSYSTLALSSIILRFGFIQQRRRQQGWLRQDLLRGVTTRAAIAEFIAAIMSLMIFVVVAQTVVLVSSPAVNQKPDAYHPVKVQLNSGASLTFTWPDNIPVNSKLALTFDFSNSPPGIINTIVSSSDSEQKLVAGQVLQWQLNSENILRKSITLSTIAEHNVSLIRPLARLVIQRPSPSQLPILLLHQLLFFVTVVSLSNFIFRYLKVNGNLAAVGALSIVSLTTLQGVHLLPEVGGLISSGLRFERNALTTNEFALGTWLLMAMILLYLSCKQPRADKK